MEGIDLNSPINFLYSSLRYFREGEYHTTRTCYEDVLVMVFDGILRFREDGTDYEIYPGQYYIQKHGGKQEGVVPSDSPKYLFVHFLADWSGERWDVLPRRGSFDYPSMRPLMEEIDRLSHGDYTICECSAKFNALLSELFRKRSTATNAGKIAEYISKNYIKGITIAELAKEFHFSKNHIINIFKKEHGMTPFEYINVLRVKKAEWLLEVTSRTAESIAYDCGFNNYSHFFKIFKSINGVSPTDWREKKRTMPLGNI